VLGNISSLKELPGIGTGCPGGGGSPSLKVFQNCGTEGRGRGGGELMLGLAYSTGLFQL